MCLLHNCILKQFAFAIETGPTVCIRTMATAAKLHSLSAVQLQHVHSQSPHPACFTCWKQKQKRVETGNEARCSRRTDYSLVPRPTTFFGCTKESQSRGPGNEAKN